MDSNHTSQSYHVIAFLPQLPAAFTVSPLPYLTNLTTRTTRVCYGPAWAARQKTPQPIRCKDGERKSRLSVARSYDLTTWCAACFRIPTIAVRSRFREPEISEGHTGTGIQWRQMGNQESKHSSRSPFYLLAMKGDAETEYRGSVRDQKPIVLHERKVD